MSLDLTGINNVNGFYTDHYLATYFEENVVDAVKRWKSIEEESGVVAPWKKLRGIGKAYHRALENERASSAGRIRREVIADLANEWLGALGYPEAQQASVPCGEVAIPVFREYSNSDGSPRVWVLLAQDSSDESDVLSARLIDAEGDSDVTGEEATNLLLFESDEPARFVLVVGLGSVALIDRNKWGEKKCMIVSLEELYRRREETTFKAVATLMSASSLYPESGESLLDELDKKSREHASGVSDSLKFALRESIELLGNEVIYDWVNNKGKSLQSDPIDERKLTLECLRYMYRMLFLLFMEARPELGFAPMKSEVYLHAYSLESLREIAEGMRDGIDTVNDDTNYLDQTLSKICALVYSGYPYDEEEYLRLKEEKSQRDVFLVPPLKAHIFDDERTPLIRDAKLRDCVMLKIIDLMSVTKSDGRRRRERISYGTLGINQLGGAYEALLSYSGFIAKEDLYEVAKDANNVNELDVGYFVPLRDLDQYEEGERVRYRTGENAGQLRCYKQGTFIYRLAGREREKSASFYTPECLTQCLVKYALKELLEDKTADDILQLTVCEPAMGSAAFLNEAINQLAEAYIAKREEETGESIPHDERARELQRTKMFIADRNVYGMDLNPVAVELGEVSLWLNTISQDGHVPWFGNQLHNGNSLIGARRRAYTPTQLKSRAQGIRWYDNEPERVPYDADHHMKRIYHFLVGDPGMSKYDDKVIKGLEPDAIKAIKNWNKDFTKPYTDSEIKQLQHLSHVVGDLWEKQIAQQRDMAGRTRDRLPVWGYEDTTNPSHLTTRQKDAIYSQMYLSEHQRNAGPFARLKFAMDYWCALWFWPIAEADELPSRDEFLMDMSLILEGTVAAAVGVRDSAVAQMQLFYEEEELNTPEQLRILDLQDTYGLVNEVDLDKLCAKFRRFALVREIANANKFFHWELEFADLFESRGGFDLIIGNPPWIKINWNEKAVLGDSTPLFDIHHLSSTEVAHKRSVLLGDSAIKEQYLKEYSDIGGLKNFLGAVSNYSILVKQQSNLYKCFLPQAMSFGNAKGVFAFIHPDGHFDDPAAGAFRRELYRRLKYHFRFVNQKKLFTDVGNTRPYSLSVYSNLESVSFDCISNLFLPETIEQCYDGVLRELEGLKTVDGKWNTIGTKSRIVHVDKSALELFSKVFDASDRWEEARLPRLHSIEYLEVLRAISGQKETLSQEECFISTMWDEALAQNSGLIVRDEHFPDSAEDLIYTGALIGLSNPYYKSANRSCDNHRSYTNIDLSCTSDSFLPRCKFSVGCTKEEYRSRVPLTQWGEPCNARARIFMRGMLDVNAERTMQAAIVPPLSGHVNSVLECSFPNPKDTALFQAELSSLPIDFYIKILGKSSCRSNILNPLPVVKGAVVPLLISRSMVLNSQSNHFSDFWQDCWDPIYKNDGWSKEDPLLPNDAFSKLTGTWSSECSLKSDYARRQAQLEIDVLVAQSLNLTLEQLVTIYKLQFSLLSQFEDDTWYDASGRIVFTPKNTGAFTMKRADFEAVKEMEGGTFRVTYQEDAIPGGPFERTVELEAPFVKCDRIEDYRTAWAFFEKKYGKQGGTA